MKSKTINQNDIVYENVLYLFLIEGGHTHCRIVTVIRCPCESPTHHTQLAAPPSSSSISSLGTAVPVEVRPNHQLRQRHCHVTAAIRRLHIAMMTIILMT